jgi:lysophospholipase L1-like esterase
MIGPPWTGERPLDERVKRLSDRLEQLCRELSVPFLPIFSRLEGMDVWRDEAQQGDGIHPNRRGYGLIHKIVVLWQPWLDWVT